MIAFPQWSGGIVEGCRAQHWVPPPRLAPYIARTVVLPPPPPLQIVDESSGGSSPERCEEVGEEGACGWRGCGARCGGVSRLSAHVSRAHAHPHSDGLFYCGWRGCTRPQRGFNARYKMLVHVRTHTNERPHTCTQCSKSFSRAENLKIHLRSHSGEKPYICPYEGCGKAYSNSSDRFKHTRTHTVDKPYSCKVPGCNKRYTDPSSLRKHVKTYKHYTPKSPLQNELSPERIEANMESTYRHITPPRLETERPAEPVYIRTIPEPIYPIRVPSYEMSYMEYTQMYEHAYRAYYTTSMPLPMPRQHVYTTLYDDRPQYEDIHMQDVRPIQNPHYDPQIEVPLNLKCSDKKIDCDIKSVMVKPIDESLEYNIVKCIDMPLDLSIRN